MCRRVILPNFNKRAGGNECAGRKLFAKFNNNLGGNKSVGGNKCVGSKKCVGGNKA